MPGGFDWFMDLSGESAVPLPTVDPVTPSAHWRPGARIAERFELLEELGSGGMGVVYHAREISSGRSVAIKLMRGSMTPDQKERFRREGIVTAALRHSGIVSIHGAGAVGGAPYLVYEYVAGGQTYRDLLNSGAPRSTLLATLRDAAQALGAAHAQGVVHRDVKPGNLLVTPEGHVRVADFGLVRAAGLENLTKTGQALGTPSYMPYEQFDGDREKIGPTVDVWALGVILHEVIAGESPFQGSANVIELIGAIEHAPIDPRRLTPSLEPELEAICKRALQRDPDRRYPDATAFAEDLSSFLAGERPIGVARDRKGAVAAVLVTVAAVVGLVAFLLLTPPSESLSTALADYGAGRANAEHLESALDVNSEAPPQLRASAHLELAMGTSGDRGTWERRLAHAKSTLALDPKRTAAGNALRARALLELGRYDEAVAAFAEARRLGSADTPLLEVAELLVGCSRWEQARRVLEAYRSAASSSDRVATRLELEVAIGLGKGSAALRLRRDELSATTTVILEAKLAQASGGDGVGPLRQLAHSQPNDANVREALIRLHLERGELSLAIFALGAAKNTPNSEEANLEQALVALRKHDVQPAARLLPRSWKLSVGRCLIKLARRERDLARQTQDPRYEVAPEALSFEERTGRAEQYLAFVRAELSGEDLGQALDGHSNARALLRRAQAARQRRAYAESVSGLKEYSESNAYDLGSYDEVLKLAEELEVALPSAREQLLTLTRVPVAQKLEKTAQGAHVPQARSPYDWTGIYRQAASNLRVDSARKLRTCVLAVFHAPRLLYALHEDLFRLSRSGALVGDEQVLQALSKQVKGSTWLDQLARATLKAFAVEFERVSPTTVELDQVLDEYPGVVFARVLRAFVNVRAGNTLAAREDLAIVREVYPNDLRTTAFVNLLLLAKEGAPIPEVLDALKAARAKNYRVGDGWLDKDYPELAPYLADPTFRKLLMKGRRGRGHQKRREKRKREEAREKAKSGSR